MPHDKDSNNNSDNNDNNNNNSNNNNKRLQTRLTSHTNTLQHFSHILSTCLFYCVELRLEQISFTIQ